MENKFLKRKQILDKNNLNLIFNILEIEKKNLSKEYNYIKICNLIRDVKIQIDTYKIILDEVNEEMIRREILL